MIWVSAACCVWFVPSYQGRPRIIVHALSGTSCLVSQWITRCSRNRRARAIAGCRRLARYSAQVSWAHRNDVERPQISSNVFIFFSVKWIVDCILVVQVRSMAPACHCHRRLYWLGRIQCFVCNHYVRRADFSRGSASHQAKSFHLQPHSPRPCSSHLHSIIRNVCRAKVAVDVLCLHRISDIFLGWGSTGNCFDKRNGYFSISTKE